MHVPIKIISFYILYIIYSNWKYPNYKYYIIHEIIRKYSYKKVIMFTIQH